MHICRHFGSSIEAARNFFALCAHAWALCAHDWALVRLLSAQADYTSPARDHGPPVDSDPAAPQATEASSEVLRVRGPSPAGVPSQPSGAPS
eukprot:16440457-Heterocapsa_arctica.AAC.2